MTTQRWRCLVCGYDKEAAERPAACPVCGAGADQFVPARRALAALARDLYDTFLPHAVAAHFSNALIPTAALFALLAHLLQSGGLERTAFAVLVVAVLSAPVSLLTGVWDWRHRYRHLKVADSRLIESPYRYSSTLVQTRPGQGSVQPPSPMQTRPGSQ